jgi:hypothetical protein
MTATAAGRFHHGGHLDTSRRALSLRAERRAGELLKVMQENEGTRGRGVGFGNDFALVHTRARGKWEIALIGPGTKQETQNKKRRLQETTS